MDADPIPTEFAIRKPCPTDWERMVGDDRRRFCGECGKHVYNLTAMSPDEAASIVAGVRDGGERRCVRLYQRQDGSLSLSNCQPPGARSAGGAWQFTIRSLMAVIAGCAALLGLAKWIAPEFKQPPPTLNSQVITGDVY